MEMLGRRFGLPGVLSLSLHGVLVAAIGVIPVGKTFVPETPPSLSVNLVEFESPAVPRASSGTARAATIPKPSLPVKMRKASAIGAVQKVPRVPRARTVRTKAPLLKSVTRAAPRPLTPAQASTTVAEPVPAPPAPASVAGEESPAVSSLEPTVGLLSLSANGVMAPLSRPLPGAEAGFARMLRDTVAEIGLARTKVRMGDNPRPEYPRPAREAGWEGTVVLRVEVLPNGEAGSVTLHKTSGHVILDTAALSAVQGWRFVPAMDGNFPLRSVVHLPVRFDLKVAN